MENSPGTAKFTTNPRLRITCVEVLPNGAITDLVSAPDGDGLHVLLWNGKEAPCVAPAIDGGAGIVYQRPELDPTVLEAMTFPRGVAGTAPLPDCSEESPASTAWACRKINPP
jgi:hypothetical protein